jgi:hypothetical protein
MKVDAKFIIQEIVQSMRTKIENVVYIIKIIDYDH